MIARQAFRAAGLIAIIALASLAQDKIIHHPLHPAQMIAGVAQQMNAIRVPK